MKAPALVKSVEYFKLMVSNDTFFLVMQVISALKVSEPDWENTL